MCGWKLGMVLCIFFCIRKSGLGDVIGGTMAELAAKLVAFVNETKTSAGEEDPEGKFTIQK